MHRAVRPLLRRTPLVLNFMIPRRHVRAPSPYSPAGATKGVVVSTECRFEDKPVESCPPADPAAEDAPKTSAGRAAVKQSIHQLLASLLALRSQDKHKEVLDMWRSIRADHGSLLNNKVLGHLVSSANRLGETALVVEAVEFAVQQNIQPEQGTLLSFMKACAESDGTPGGGCGRAVGMLDKLQGNNALNAPIFEEVAAICFSSGKWRRALDVLNQMLGRGLQMSEKIQNSALQSCAGIIDRSALTAAHQLFRNSVREGIALRPSVSAALISGFSEAGMHAEADSVWTHLEEAGLPITDAIFAARISQLGHTGHADKAAEVVGMSMSITSQNRQSINNMTNVLLKAGRVDDACAYLKTMKGLKKVKLTPQLVEYHVKGLVQGGHIPAAINFLEHWKMFHKSALGHIWQELFKDCLYLGKFHGGELVYRHATNAANKRCDIDTSGWLSRLFAEVGEAGQSKYLLHLSKTLPPAQDPDTVFDLLRSLCLCRLFTEAVDIHQSIVVDAERPVLGGSHLLVYMLCRHDMWREAKMVIKDVHRLLGNRQGCLPQLFTHVVQIAGQTVKGRGNTQDLWELQQQLACRPTWNCARYSIKVLFAECQWEKCLDIFQSRHVCTGYRGTRLDQKTMTRVIKAHGHLERWMDAMEVFADYLEEAALSKGRSGAVVDPSDRRSVSIDMVIAVVMDVLAQYDQERLIPNVLSRLGEKGVPISEATLKEAFSKTTTDHVTTTLHIHRRLLHIAMISGFPKESLASFYRRATRGKHQWLNK